MSNLPQTGQVGHYGMRDAAGVVRAAAAVVDRIEDNGTLDITVYSPGATALTVLGVAVSESLAPGRWSVNSGGVAHSERVYEAASRVAAATRTSVSNVMVAFEKAVQEAGARNSAADADLIQQIFDAGQNIQNLASQLGAQADEDSDQDEQGVEEADASVSAGAETLTALEQLAAATGVELTSEFEPQNLVVGEQHMIALTESQTSDQIREASYDASAPNTVTLTIIKPGLNSSGQRLYTPEAVKSIAEGMVGRKMFLNHPTATESRERPEGDLKYWVSTIIETWVDANGAAKGKAKICNAEFRDFVASLSADGLLESLGASINAIAVGERKISNGVETFVVTAIKKDDPFRSVDWVTEPGAGGRAEVLESAARQTPTKEEIIPVPVPANQTTPAVEQPQTPVVVTPAVEANVEQPTQEAYVSFDLFAAVKADVETMGEKLQILTDFINDLKQNDQIDVWMADIYASEAAKRVVKSRLSGQPGITEAMVKATYESVMAEVALINGSETPAKPSGPTGVRGMGAGAETPDLRESAQSNRESLRRIFEAQGLTPEQVEIALNAR